MTIEMNIYWAVILVVVGLAVLVKSADWLVDGAVGIALRMGISPFVIGVTIVAMGTSAPEVAASISAALKDSGDIAIGNVYGSNIANLALVGGICGMIRPLVIRKSVLRVELPAMLGCFLLLWPLFAHNGMMTRWEGFFLLVLFSGLVAFTVIGGIRNRSSEIAEIVPGANETEKHLQAQKPVLTQTRLILCGLAGLAIGADIAVRGAVFLGESFGFSQAVIGLTIIAIGTSLPELMTSAVAAFKGNSEISIGNLVGSNIFNTLLVIGSAAAVRPFVISPRLIGLDYWVCFGVGVLFVAIALLYREIGRKSGALLLLCYLVYMGYLLTFARGI